MEDGECVDVGAQGLPHRIGAGDMAAQDAAAVVGGFEDQRNLVGVEPLFAHRHQCGERVFTYQRMQCFRPFRRSGRAIHQKPRNSVNFSTGSRSVTSLFSGAALSA